MLRFHRALLPQVSRAPLRGWSSRSMLYRFSSSPAATASTPAAQAAAAGVKAAVEEQWKVPKHNRSVANWLYACAAVVGGVVCFGGVTRLTNSGLSIVNWKPISGLRPPLNDKEWEEEFANYQQYPQFKQTPDMTMGEFQFIFFWEWAHRVLARGVGVVFAVPLAYYWYRGYFAGNTKFALGLLGILGLGGAQGFMGWYMVRSGLDNKLLKEKKKAKVSAYRLASHLFLAFAIFSFMLRMGYGLKLPVCTQFARKPQVQLWARVSCTTMFVTAMSGAFVAGLHGGYYYNDGFPLMSGGIIPPMDHLTNLEPLWRNFFENPSMAQTCHRLWAFATFMTIVGLNVACSRRRGVIPARVTRTLNCVNTALILQVTLGMWTILSTVDTPVAASHQVGALVLLATLIRMCTVVGSRGLILA